MDLKKETRTPAELAQNILWGMQWTDFLFLYLKNGANAWWMFQPDMLGSLVFGSFFSASTSLKKKKNSINKNFAWLKEFPSPIPSVVWATSLESAVSGCCRNTGLKRFTHAKWLTVQACRHFPLSFIGVCSPGSWSFPFPGFSFLFSIFEWSHDSLFRTQILLDI